MSDMVEKILKAGRLDPMTGTYRLEREPCDVIEIFNEVVNGLAGPAQEKGILLTHSVDGGVPIVNADRGLIISAFTNLAENAVKYTPEDGTIEIALTVENNDLLFRVSDDGYGISEEDQLKLFRRNVRVHRKEWKRVKGSGLGLFIVKNVAQRHGGDTWVESVEGQGSTFYFSIPLEGANLVGGDSYAGSTPTTG
jgi:signal transduction histidine kinase